MSNVDHRQLADRLAAVKHHECEDCWYSCPESDEGCCNETLTECNCNVPLIRAAAWGLRGQADQIDMLTEMHSQVVRENAGLRRQLERALAEFRGGMPQ